MRFKFTFSGTEESTYINETEVIHVLCLKKKKNKAKFQQFFFFRSDDSILWRASVRVMSIRNPEVS